MRAKRIAEAAADAHGRLGTANLMAILLTVAVLLLVGGVGIVGNWIRSNSLAAEIDRLRAERSEIVQQLRDERVRDIEQLRLERQEDVQRLREERRDQVREIREELATLDAKQFVQAQKYARLEGWIHARIEVRPPTSTARDEEGTPP